MTAYIAALRTAYDPLLAHMATEGGVPMTDELARAIEVVEAHDASAPSSRVAGEGDVAIWAEELNDLLRIESCVRATMRYTGMASTEERNLLARLDAIRAAREAP